MRNAAPVAATAVLLWALPAAAQGDDWSARGWFIGVETVGSSLSLGGGRQKLDYGGGVGATVGVSITERVAVLVHADRAGLLTPDSSDRYVLRQADAIGRLMVTSPRSPLQAFLTGGFTYHSASGGTYEGATGSFTFSGLAASLGGGGQLMLPKRFALDLTVLLTEGTFSTARGNGGSLPHVTTQSARAHAGLTYYLERSE